VRARAPRKAEVLAGTDLAALEARQAELAGRVQQVAATRDAAALATPAEAAQWRKLDELDERVAALPPGEKRDALAERARVLRGLLSWQLDADYKLRLWRLQSSLRQTDAALDETRGRLALVEQAGDLAPRQTEGFEARVVGLGRRMSDLQPRIEAAAAAQERVLAAIAVQELQAQKARLASYASQAQFALATLYDGAASRGGQ
jgi:hypothetical protein